MTPVIMERRAQVISIQQQVTELRSSQGKRGKTPVAKEKTSHPRSRFHNPDTCSRIKTTITSFIRHSRPAWNSLRLKESMKSDYISVPTIACTTHFWSIRWKDAPPSRFKNGLQRHWELGCRSIPNEVLKLEFILQSNHSCNGLNKFRK